MDNQELNSNAKLTSFTPEEATPINNPDPIINNETSFNNTSNSVLNKEVVTRPVLWGLVVFLVFFSFVIGAVSVYRMYQTEDLVEEINVEPTNTIAPSVTPDNTLETTPVNEDTNLEADLIESEIKSVNSDLEEDVYSDEALGL
jgi:hypothetical protein